MEAPEWTPAERAFVESFRERPNPASRHELLTLARRVLDRAHLATGPVRASRELLRIVRMLDDEALFPGVAALEERLTFLAYALDVASQRPVVERVAEAALALELRYGWSRELRWREAFVTACFEAEVPVIATVVLETRLTGNQVAGQRLQGLHFQHRLNRLTELIRFVDTSATAAEIPDLVHQTYVALFEYLEDEDRATLAQAVVRGLEKQKMFERHDRWHQLLDPLVLQNRTNHKVLASVIFSLRQQPSAVLTPYARLYLQVPRRHLRPELVVLASRGGTSLLPLLASLKQDRTSYFGRPTAIARAAKAAADAIIKREGLTDLQGGLALSDGTEGALALSEPAEGTFTVPAPEPAALTLWERLTGW